uniref:Uncharacterized protein n=1 Tax=Romanomermis culicivorax TaxID=13658 RepID=A0A915L7J0_ROMCU
MSKKISHDKKEQIDGLTEIRRSSRRDGGCRLAEDLVDGRCLSKNRKDPFQMYHNIKFKLDNGLGKR